VQQAVFAYRQHADKWKCKAQAIGLEANDARQSAENEQQQMMDQTARLEGEFAWRKQLRAKCELMLGQFDEQAQTLKSSVALANKNEREEMRFCWTNSPSRQRGSRGGLRACGGRAIDCWMRVLTHCLDKYEKRVSGAKKDGQ
jgi:Na+-translocating ferredoxin:NAD+ oxidoreductase RnfC subunit